MVVPELRKLMAKLKFRSLYFRQATVFWTMTRCQSIPLSLIAFLMYLKYKCIVPARFARRIYFLGTYNLGAHSLCISSSVFFPKKNDLLTPNMPYNTCCLTSVFPNCVVQQLVVLFYWSGFFLHLMSFSSEYFRWYKTTCSQDAFLGNYGNSIYFKIGLGFFFTAFTMCFTKFD